MTTVTITQKEYKNLVEKRIRYERVLEVLMEDFFAPPPVRSRKLLLRSFKQTRKYSPEFLKSLGNALKRSTYFQL